MIKKTLLLLVFTSLVIFPFRSFAQGLTAEQVEAVMEDPYVQSAFQNCALGQRVTEELDLVLIINKKGKAALAFTDPEVTAETFSCFQKVVQTLSFPATGQKFEITYPLYLQVSGMSSGEPPVTPPPPDTGPPPAGTETPPPYKGATVAPAGTYKPPPPPAGTMQPSASSEFWTKELKMGRTFMGVGCVMMGVGLAGILAGVIVYKQLDTDTNPDNNNTGLIVLMVSLVGGGALTYGGLHLFIRGEKKAKKAKSVLQMQYGFLIPKVAVFPTLHSPGIGSSLSWSF